MKKMIKPLMFGALVGALLATGLNASAQPQPATPSGAAQSTKPKRDWYPFYGTVASVDLAAKTVSLTKKEGARVLQTDAGTTLEQNGQPAALANIKPGNYLHGKLHKNSAGQEVVTDAKIELAPPAKVSKETNHVASATAAVAAPVVTSTNDTSTATNAPAKKKKKKSTATSTTTTTQ